MGSWLANKMNAQKNKTKTKRNANVSIEKGTNKMRTAKTSRRDETSLMMKTIWMTQVEHQSNEKIKDTSKIGEFF